MGAKGLTAIRDAAKADAFLRQLQFVRVPSHLYPGALPLGACERHRLERALQSCSVTGPLPGTCPCGPDRLCLTCPRGPDRLFLTCPHGSGLLFLTCPRGPELADMDWGRTKWRRCLAS